MSKPHPSLDLPDSSSTRLPTRIRSEASALSFTPRGAVRCVGLPMFRTSVARDVGCLLDLDPTVHLLDLSAAGLEPREPLSFLNEVFKPNRDPAPIVRRLKRAKDVGPDQQRVRSAVEQPRGDVSGRILV